MERTIIYNTNKYNGISIREFLKLQGYSHHILVSLKKHNNSVCIKDYEDVFSPAYLNYRLKESDTLRIIIPEEKSSENIIPVNIPLNIVYEDDDLIVINKPAGMPIHPSINNHNNTLANALAYYYNKDNDNFIFRCINRLDRDTTGLTIIAKNALSSAILSSMVTNREISKTYYAICEGQPILNGTIDAPILRKPGSTIERMVGPDGERAVTHFKILETVSVNDSLSKNSDVFSFAKIQLETGRTHQIRVHFKHIGHPLIGDFLYNPDSNIIKRQALHCGHIELIHPITKEQLIFTAPIPNDMKILFPNAKLY